MVCKQTVIIVIDDNIYLSSIRESNFCLERFDILVPIPTFTNACNCLIVYSWKGQEDGGIKNLYRKSGNFRC